MMEHIFSDLPGSLTRSFDKVDLNDCVIVKTTDYSDSNIWMLQKDVIERRARQLNAFINWDELPAGFAAQKGYKLWFSSRLPIAGR